MRTGTSSRWTNDSRTTFNVYAHLHTGLACFIGIALHRHFSPRLVAEESVHMAQPLRLRRGCQ
jgi:hypothetical protein